MEKVYWIRDDAGLREMNKEIKKHKGRVTMISAAASTDEQSSRAHAFVVSYSENTGAYL